MLTSVKTSFRILATRCQPLTVTISTSCYSVPGDFRGENPNVMDPADRVMALRTPDLLFGLMGFSLCLQVLRRLRWAKRRAAFLFTISTLTSSAPPLCIAPPTATRSTTKIRISSHTSPGSWPYIPLTTIRPRPCFVYPPKGGSHLPITPCRLPPWLLHTPPPSPSSPPPVQSAPLSISTLCCHAPLPLYIAPYQPRLPFLPPLFLR